VVDSLRVLSLLAATLATGLMAGLYFAFSCAVMPGLARTDDRTFVAAMQWINVRILNGCFALAFGGAFVLTAVALVLHLPADGRAVLPWVVVALVLYVGTLLVTFRVNVPLNDALVAAGDPSAMADVASVREGFEPRWVRWNAVRTVLAVGALVALAGGLSGS
jgi:uncharacterized membrane protein